MAGKERGGDDEEMESLLSDFDQICEELRNRVTENQLLKSNLNGEMNKRQALHLALKSLKQENERLTKLYTESLNNLVDQVEHRTSCQSLKEQLKRMNDGGLINQHALEVTKQEYARKIADLEARVRGLLHQKATDQATVYQLRQDLEAHKLHIQHLATRLNRIHLNMESKYEFEIQELKNALQREQEDKKELNNKVQRLEKECQSACETALIRSKSSNQGHSYLDCVHLNFNNFATLNSKLPQITSI